jgi:hypothetical protein
MRNRRKAQSTLEYIIVFTAIVGGVLLAANTLVKPRVVGILDHVSNQADVAVRHINFK